MIPDWVAGFVGGLVTVWYVWACGRWRCGCGRGRFPLYWPSLHEAAWVMLTASVGVTATALAWALAEAGSPWIRGTWVLIAAWEWVRWWFHEKDRILRRLRDAGRRVVVTVTGLRVVPT